MSRPKSPRDGKSPKPDNGKAPAEAVEMKPMEGGASIPGSASSQSLNSVDRERERNNSLSPREKLTRGSSSNSAAPALPPAPSPPPPGTASGRSPRDNKKGPLNSSPRNVNGPAAAASAAAAAAAGGAGPGPGGRLRGATPQSLRRSFTGWCAGKGKSPRLEAGSPKKPSLRKQSERRRSHPRKKTTFADEHNRPIAVHYEIERRETGSPAHGCCVIM